MWHLACTTWCRTPHSPTVIPKRCASIEARRELTIVLQEQGNESKDPQVEEGKSPLHCSGAKEKCDTVRTIRNARGSLIVDERDSELPILVNRFDSPFELFTESLGEKFLDRHVELLAEDNSEAGVDIVL